MVSSMEKLRSHPTHLWIRLVLHNDCCLRKFAQVRESVCSRSNVWKYGCVYILCWIRIIKNKLEESEKNQNIREYMVQGWKYENITKYLEGKDKKLKYQVIFRNWMSKIKNQGICDKRRKTWKYHEMSGSKW